MNRPDVVVLIAIAGFVIMQRIGYHDGVKAERRRTSRRRDEFWRGVTSRRCESCGVVIGGQSHMPGCRQAGRPEGRGADDPA